MSKRKVTTKKAKPKAAARKAPPIVRKPKAAKPARAAKPATPEPADDTDEADMGSPDVQEGDEGTASPPAPSRPTPPRGAPAGLARALAAASADVGDVEVKSKAEGTQALPAQDEPVVAKARPLPPVPSAPATVPKPRATPDDEDDGPVVVKGGGGPVSKQSLGDGIQVASKGPAKFSLEDLEALRKSIVIKGAGRIVAGINLDELKYDQEGLIAVVTQDRLTGAVLMQAWANKEALEKSLTTNEMTYFSRQRNKLWTKGEESGNTQRLHHVRIDCDKDSILAVVDQTGVACHRETGTCFNDDRSIPVAGFLGELDAKIAQRAKDKPEGSYTTRLLEDPSLAAGKVVEEAKEVATVLKGKPNKDTLQHEAADLLYHLLVACRGKGVGLRDILAELAAREGKAKGKDGKA